ncbi:hypothetical protein Pgy4_40005, partial [Pseudomonas savastanoi pv. glycinea str. race 4]
RGMGVQVRVESPVFGQQRSFIEHLEQSVCLDRKMMVSA